MSENEGAASVCDRLEFRFRWDKSEHRRLCRTLQWEARRGSKVPWLLNLWFGFIALVGVHALISARDGASIGSALVPLTIVGSWFVFDRWGLSYLSARSYERDHAPCTPNDQVRVLDADGIAAQCTTSNTSLRWTGIVKIQETPEFFFFTTRSCAIQLPKRAIGDLGQLRGWLNHAAENRRLANLRMEPTRR